MLSVNAVVMLRLYVAHFDSPGLSKHEYRCVADVTSLVELTCVCIKQWQFATPSPPLRIPTPHPTTEPGTFETLCPSCCNVVSISLSISNSL